MSFVEELQRRNVLRVAIAYLAGSWLLIQIAETLLPIYGIGNAAVRIVVAVLGIGFVLAVIFAWVFELTPEGLKKESDVDRSQSIATATGKKLDRGIIVVLALALGFFAFDRFVLSESRIESARQEGRSEALIESYGEKSIAVLPFLDMSSAGDQEYMGDGIAEELLNLLAKVQQLRVISRSSAFSFKGKDIDIPSIGEQLGVAHILEGSVRKAGNTIRITAQLIDTRTDTHIWSETYDRELTDIFKIQDEIAATVVGALKIALLDEAPKTTDTDPEAFALYLQADYLRMQPQTTVDDYLQAEKLLRQSLDIAPDFAPAWHQLGDVLANLGFTFERFSHDEAYKRTREHIEKALEIDPQYARAWSDLGDLEIHHTWDFTKADQYIKKALALSPGDYYVLVQAAELAGIFGQFDIAINLYRQVVPLDPLSPAHYYSILGRAYLRAGRLEKAADSFRLRNSLRSPGSGPHRLPNSLLLAQGDAQAALEGYEQLDVGSRRLAGIAVAQHALGNGEASNVALQALIEWNGTQAFAYRVAQVHAFRGEVDSAFEWLEQSFDKREKFLPGQLFDNSFENLRDDPRWPAFLKKMGYPQEQN